MADYERLNSYPVENKEDFYKSGINGATTCRKLESAIKRLLVVSEKHIILNVLEENVGFRFDILGAGNLKNRFTAQIYYLPNAKLLDIYDENTVGTGIPLISFYNKKPIQKNYSILLQTVKLETLFNPIISAL